MIHTQCLDFLLLLLLGVRRGEDVRLRERCDWRGESLRDLDLRKIQKHRIHKKIIISIERDSITILSLSSFIFH